MAKANGHYQQFGSFNMHADDNVVPRTSEPFGPPADVPIVSAGSVLTDGRILDVVRRPGLHNELVWLVWNDGEVSLSKQVECGGRIYTPPIVGGDVVSAVQLPEALGPCLAPRELFERMQTLTHTFVDVNDDDAFLIVAFAVATFFADRLGLAPYLFVCGPPGSGKTTLLRILYCMTRRGLLAGEMTRASLYRLVDTMTPTLLIDESDLTSGRSSRDIMRLLRNGNRPGADIYVNEHAFSTFSPKVICGRTPVEDVALASRGIHITMLPTRNNYPFLGSEQQQEISAYFQPRLERFRLEHYNHVQIADAPDHLQLTPRMKDMFRVLAAPMLDDAELVERLGECLILQNEDSQFTRLGDPEWMVAAALYYHSHSGDPQVFIGNLARTTDALLVEAGETYRLTPERISRIARHQLCVKTRRVGRGTYILMTAEMKKQIHVLARKMGITRADIMDPAPVLAGFAGPPCASCEEFGLYKLPDGRELRPMALPPSKRRRKRLCDEEETTEE